MKIIQATRPVNDSLQLTGRAIVEDMNFARVLVGRVSTIEIAALIERHGERLLERNIRRYLGLQGNRVNEAIRDTLRSQERSNFYFYNNGITLTCDKFSHNALQSGDYQVRIENLQIINGGQTCMTIFKTLQNPDFFHDSSQSFVLVRLYKLSSDNEDRSWHHLCHQQPKPGGSTQICVPTMNDSDAWRLTFSNLVLPIDVSVQTKVARMI